MISLAFRYKAASSRGVDGGIPPGVAPGPGLNKGAALPPMTDRAYACHPSISVGVTPPGYLMKGTKDDMVGGRRERALRMLSM